MKVKELHPLPTKKVLFKFSSFKFLPKSSGCYAIANFLDDIIYIGLSENLFDRFQQHLNNSEKTGITENGRAIWFYFILKTENLEALERTWLNQYVAIHGMRPILNKIDSPIR